MPGEYSGTTTARSSPTNAGRSRTSSTPCAHAEPGRPILFFGVGPTLHHVFLAAGTASEIHLADSLPANLARDRALDRRDLAAHDWRPFVRYTLECEGEADPTDEQISRREELTRAKITRLLQADARLPEPVANRY